MRRQRPRASPDSPAAETPDSEYDDSAPSSNDAMIKKMVRLALASEYSRLPIRRTDISTKVLGEQGARQFKIVFDSAQRELREVFGMEMTELPAREKVTVTQRRGKSAIPIACLTRYVVAGSVLWISTHYCPPRFEYTVINEWR